MEQTLFFIILTVICADFLIERILEFLNIRRLSPELPDDLRDNYDRVKYFESQIYEQENARFSLVFSIFSFILILGMLVFSGFAFLDQLVRGISERPVPMALLYFGILFLAFDLVSLPFALYKTFVIEDKYGFNKTSYKTFATDKIKSWLLGAIIGGGLLALVVWVYSLTDQWFWLIVWGLVSMFSLFMAMFHSTLIVPLFNKQRLLEDGPLKQAIQNLSLKLDFKLKNIYVIDGSKRSTKANAYFTGLGSKKRIVLYDTLINDLEIEELLAVLCHEIGHYKKKHIQKGLLVSLLQSALLLYILSSFISEPVLSQAFGVEQHSFHIALISFGILYSPVSFLIGLFMNIFSRKNEFEADKYASDNYNGEFLVSSLIKLSEKNLSNLTPHPLYVFFYYSHPPLLQRIRKLRN